MARPFRKKGRAKLLLAAIKKAGTDAALARLLGINRQAVGQWNDIPPRRRAWAEKWTAVKD